MPANKRLLILPGDGVGPEVMREVRRVMDWMDRRRRVTFSYTEDYVGGAGIEHYGEPISDDVIQAAREADAVLFGAVGGRAGTSSASTSARNWRSCVCARSWAYSRTCAPPSCSTRWSTPARSSRKSSAGST